MTYKTPDDVIEQAAEEATRRFATGPWYSVSPDETARAEFEAGAEYIAPLIARAALKAARDKVHWYMEHLLASGEVHGAELIITELDEMIGDDHGH